MDLSTQTRRNSVTLSGPPNTYEFQIQTHCGRNEISSFSSIQEFTLSRRNLTVAESRSANITEDIVIPASTSDIAAKVFPNPVREILHLSYETAENAVLTIQHSSGRVVLQQSLQVDTKTHQLQCADLESGIYILTIMQAGKAAVVQKFVKESIE